MNRLVALTPYQLARAEYLLRYPPSGGRIEAAKEYGIDLTMLIEQLRLTPAERARKLEAAVTVLQRIRGTARKRS